MSIRSYEKVTRSAIGTEAESESPTEVIKTLRSVTRKYLLPFLIARE